MAKIPVGFHTAEGFQPTGGVIDTAALDAEITAHGKKTFPTKETAVAARIPSILNTAPTISTDVPTRTAGSYPTGYLELPHNTDRITRGGDVHLIEYTNSGFTSQRNTLGPNATGNRLPWFIEFDYYGQDFSFVGRDNVGANAYLWMWVDGKPITATSENTGANAINLAFGVRFQWATPALRRIRIYLRGTDFKGLRISPTDSVTPTTLHQIKTYWLGDSWIEGAFDVHVLNNFGHKASIMLNTHHYADGQGGTGYVNNGGGGTRSPYTNTNRLAAVGIVKPEYLIIEGSINDDSTAAATIQTAATTVYNQIKELSPDTRIIVIGPQSTGNTVSAGRSANKSAVQAAANGATNVIGFIDPLAEQWITGTGKTGATTNNGPADYMLQTDGAHLTATGADIYGRRAATAIAKTITTPR